MRELVILVCLRCELWFVVLYGFGVTQILVYFGVLLCFADLVVFGYVVGAFWLSFAILVLWSVGLELCALV